jgi:hypothetical protein
MTDALAGSGAAAGAGAAERATAEAVAGVNGSAELVLAFPAGIDADRAAAAAAGAAAGAPVAGMTGNGVIGPEGAIEAGCSVLAFARGTPIGLGVSRGAGRSLERAARHAVAEAIGAAKSAGAAERISVILLLDTRSGDQAEAVRGAYAAAGPRIPLVGGGAGGAEPAQLAGRMAYRDTVVAVAVGGRRPAGIGLAHGCRSRGAPAIATASRGRHLHELDGRPAAEVYLERLGYDPDLELSPEEFEALAVTHPLAQPELSGHSRLRHVLRRASEGSLECATHIPANAAVEFTHQTPADIVGASGRAVEMALGDLGGEAPRAALIFDCAGRKRAVAGALTAQVDGLIDGFGPAPPALAGLFSHGEICRLRGAKGDRNHAVVVAAFA